MKKITAPMPSELKRMMKLFDKLGVAYLIFKCEHILEGQNKNLDVLLKKTDDYSKASQILEEQGYVLYMPESVEKYKKMYVFFEGENVSAIHLHREVAWHGIIYLDKEKIFFRASGKAPSAEDSLLIHSAHALFENFRVEAYHKLLLEKYRSETKDWGYIDSQLLQFGWKKAFYKFIRMFSITPALVLEGYGSRLQKNPLSILALLSNKALKNVGRRISLRRKGYLISLVGMNGSGKSTTKEALLSSYLPLSKFVAGQYGYYYGWKPSLLGKAMVLLKKNKGEKIFDRLSEEKAQRFNLFHELLFSFIYTKFLVRYVTVVYPHLRKNMLVVTDRYFYDLYGQYPYSEKSLVLRLLPIPKPDQLVMLDVEAVAAMKRDKAGKVERKVQPQHKLEGQRKRYLEIAVQNNALIINAEQSFEENVSKIIKSTWRKYLRKNAL